MLFSKLFINIFEANMALAVSAPKSLTALLVDDISVKKLEVRRFTLAIQVSYLSALVVDSRYSSSFVSILSFCDGSAKTSQKVNSRSFKPFHHDYSNLVKLSAGADCQRRQTR